MEKPGLKPGVCFSEVPNTNYQILAPQARIKYEATLAPFLSIATKKSATLCLLP
jgi:hypothetical protein